MSKTLLIIFMLAAGLFTYVVMFKIGHHYIELTDKVKAVFADAARETLNNVKCDAYNWKERNEIYIKYSGTYAGNSINTIEENLKKSIMNALLVNKELLIKEVGLIYVDVEIHVSAKIYANSVFYKKIEFTIEKVPLQ